LVTAASGNTAPAPAIDVATGDGALMVWNWTVRLAMPLLLGVLAAALHVMWAEAPYAPGLFDILGTIAIGLTMLLMVVWCVCAWLGGAPDRSPTDTRVSLN